MNLDEFVPDRDTVVEYWPLLVGLALVVVGNVVYYGVMGNDVRPLGPPLFVALLVVALLEIGRALYRRT